MQTILIVDDNIDVCKPLASILRQMGYNSHFTTGGEATLKFVAGTVPDLVILDVMMPDMDGLEVLRRLKTDTRTQAVPVVMFSAIADSEFRAHALSKGAIDYWIKACVDFTQLRQRISSLLPGPPTDA